MTNPSQWQPERSRRRPRQPGSWLFLSVLVVALVCLLWCAGVAAFRMSTGR